jgi:hypothetical protein
MNFGVFCSVGLAARDAWCGHPVTPATRSVEREIRTRLSSPI